MNENEFEINGKVYVSKVNRRPCCDGCAFDDSASKCTWMIKLPNCSARYRDDGRSVIFVEKQQ